MDEWLKGSRGPMLDLLRVRYSSCVLTLLLLSSLGAANLRRIVLNIVLGCTTKISAWINGDFRSN